MDAVRLSLFLLVQVHFCWGQNTMVAPSQPIMAPVGSDVTLPCQLEPVKDLRDMVVEWARHDLTPRYVHIRRDGLDLLMDQNSLYLGRTSLSESRLQQGDMSLSLARVRPSDGGTYTCYMPQIKVKAEVTLLVVSVAPPSVSLTKEHSGSPVLRCESRGWYPEPELEWLDSEGTVLLRTEAQRGASDELFTVSSRLSVEQRLGNTFTCRVKQQESGQSREAQLSIADEFLESCPSFSWAWILLGLGLGLGLVLAAAAALAVWKFKSKRNKSENKNIELGEREIMIKNEDTTYVLKPEDAMQRLYLKESVPELKENLEKTENELRYVCDVISKLTGMKHFLMKIKEKPQETMNLLTTNINNERKRLSKFFKKHFEKEKIENLIEELERQKKECNGTIEEIDRQIKAADDLIMESAQRKGQLEAELKKMEKEMEKQMEKKRRCEETESKGPEEKVSVQVKNQDQGAQGETKQDGGADETCAATGQMGIDTSYYGK